MRVGAGGVLGLETMVGLAIVEPGGALPCSSLYFNLPTPSAFSICTSISGRFRYDADPQTRDTCGRLLENLVALLLRHAAEDAEFLALRLKLLVVVEAVEDLLLGLVADGAGVVEHQPGLFDRRNLAIPLLHRACRSPFRSRAHSSGSRRFRGRTSCQRTPAWLQYKPAIIFRTPRFSWQWSRRCRDKSLLYPCVPSEISSGHRWAPCNTRKILTAPRATR